MTLEVIQHNGHAAIKAHLLKVAHEKRQWKLFVIDYAGCGRGIPTITIARNIAAGLSLLEGMVATTPSQMILCLVRTQVPAEIFMEELKAFMPRGYDFTEVYHTPAAGQVEKISMTVEALETIEARSEKVIYSPFYLERRNRNENRVMIIDDDPYTRSLMASILMPRYEVIDASDKDDLTGLYKKHLPDIVFLDIHMPRVNGFQVLERFLNFDKDAYVLMLSADAVAKNVALSAEHGAKGFLGKPLRRETLNNYVQKCPTLTAPASLLMKA